MDELYVVARRVLLDALEALASHRSSMILVGAHAIYLRVGEADVAVAPYTTDGDLALDPESLDERPPIETILTNAGFRAKSADSVGVWIANRPTAHNTHTEMISRAVGVLAHADELATSCEMLTNDLLAALA